MRKTWLIEQDGKLTSVTNSGVEHDHFLAELTDEVPWVEAYDLFIEEDGTKTALISETKCADLENERKKEEYELSK